MRICCHSASAGFTVALINYPGSIGFGQKQIERLSANCGELDVEHCYAVLEYLISLGVAPSAKGKRFIMGGSHGGFVAAHLSSRFPDSFDAVVLQNPVIDLPSNLATSDIPDWFVKHT